MVRRSPINHPVSESTRKGRKVRSFNRGSGSRINNPHPNGYNPPQNIVVTIFPITDEKIAKATINNLDKKLGKVSPIQKQAILNKTADTVKIARSQGRDKIANMYDKLVDKWFP